MSPPLLTVDDHLEAGGAWSPGEVQLTVSQAGAVLNDGRLACVQLGSGAVEPHHLTVPHHHQTHPTDLGDGTYRERERDRMPDCHLT